MRIGLTMVPSVKPGTKLSFTLMAARASLADGLEPAPPWFSSCDVLLSFSEAMVHSKLAPTRQPGSSS